MEDLEHQAKTAQFGRPNAKKNIMGFGASLVKLGTSSLTILIHGVNLAQMLLKTRFMSVLILLFVLMNVTRG